MAKRKKTEKGTGGTKLTVELSASFKQKLDEASLLYGSQARIVRAALIMFLEAEQEDKTAAFRRCKTIEEEDFARHRGVAG